LEFSLSSAEEERAGLRRSIGSIAKLPFYHFTILPFTNYELQISFDNHSADSHSHLNGMRGGTFLGGSSSNAPATKSFVGPTRMKSEEICDPALDRTEPCAIFLLIV
jgi:hypothetical protein